MTGFILVVIAVILNVAAQVALKWAVVDLCPVGEGGRPGVLSLSSILQHPLRVAFNPWFFLGITLYATAVINWLIVLGRMDLSLAYPLMSIGYILTLVIGALLFKEQISLMRLGGVLVIMFGVYLITRPGSPVHG